MSSFIALAVLGLLGVSLGIPVENPPYNPKDFYPAGRIVGGTEAPEGYAPYMMALVVGDIIRGLVCGASVVSLHCVVTAAHCIDPMVSWIDGQLVHSARGLVGSNSLSSGYTALRFSGHENHPEWNWVSIKNDVGVLRLADKLPLGHRVRPIALSFDWVGGGERIRVTGWGRLTAWGDIPDKLQLLYVESLSPEQCEEGVREAIAISGPSPAVHPEIELCTRHPRGAGHGMCNGDSGSALVDALGRQVALVSWGWPCARGHPDVHARLSGFRDWLLPRVEGGEGGGVDS